MAAEVPPKRDFEGHVGGRGGFADLEEMEAQQVINWFTNKRRRTKTSVYKKPPMNASFQPILDWMIENPGKSASVSQKQAWAHATGKSVGQIHQWMQNQKKRNSRVIERGRRPAVA